MFLFYYIFLISIHIYLSFRNSTAEESPSSSGNSYSVSDILHQQQDAQQQLQLYSAQYPTEDAYRAQVNRSKFDNVKFEKLQRFMYDK